MSVYRKIQDEMFPWSSEHATEADMLTVEGDYSCQDSEQIYFSRLADYLNNHIDYQLIIIAD